MFGLLRRKEAPGVQRGLTRIHADAHGVNGTSASLESNILLEPVTATSCLTASYFDGRNLVRFPSCRLRVWAFSSTFRPTESMNRRLVRSTTIAPSVAFSAARCPTRWQGESRTNPAAGFD